jgi:hypothetical protein
MFHHHRSMYRAMVGWALVLWVSGCTVPNPKACADGICNDQSLPFCDVDGSLGGSPNTCIAVSCSPLEFVACRGDDELVCNAVGTKL